MSPSLSRRQVLTGAAAIGTGLAVGPAVLGRAARAAQQFDVVVVGCGAAGMTAALRLAKRGLSVVVVEKAPTFGGSAARSGAGIWIPNNEIILAAGVPDTPAKAATYLAAVVDGDVPTAKQQAFLDNGPPMISFVMGNSPLRFRFMEGYPDYYPEFAGGMPQGRSIEPDLFDGKLLGAELSRLNPAYMPTPPGVSVFSADYKWLVLSLVNAKGFAVAAECVARYAAAVLHGKTPLTMGQALAAGLRAGLLGAGVPVWLDTPFQDLRFDASGRVTGVVVTRDGSSTVIGANRGVIVAAGGFEHNLAMRLAYQREPIGTEWTVGAKENTGDGIQAGLRAGAATDFLDDSWWGPAIPTPGEPYFCLAERTLPGSLMVNSAGVRFVNEAAPYSDVVHVMYDKNGITPDIPAWLIFDQNYRNRYLFGDIAPAFPFPDSWYDAGAVYRSSTLGGLADKIGVPASALSATVSRFNGFARTGRDTDFHRGDSTYDHYYTDPAVRPNSCLAPLWLPPYYACKIVPGDLGTKGGLRTDARARVLHAGGPVIPGLYAAGNSSAAVMGHSYAGAGSTIGPAMTFGYIAANDIADGT
ncbi:3-oxosteroid 1-dehydrogenase [Couchioplanes caeruleus]|uniref:3-oxosteroid 1-dehydrogenase n=2 Tax=Couchioplanes caeruleus TaxID=56438 RepID=A0A1K0GTY9_9ACTN|nr:3-oxosteroid 1-dehydrogenase [Couchioplanes caeruleus]OJF14764.1 3-ketosteroid-delta-1-dehydrogenase [Couchioplanes caeruleus subsp. caeruleus]ROP28085.1 3-oxosteroid 1-dehydrogenase [Couchioplanes caeruleus]